MSNPEQTEAPTILDYYVELYRWRKRLLVNFLIVAVVATGVAFLLPKWYKATATILPSQSSGIGGFGLSALQSALPFSALGGLLGGGDQTMTYIAILESYTVMEGIAKKFNLTEIYDTEHIQKTVQTLRSNVAIEMTNEGVVVVEVLAKDSQRAADMANAYVFLLDSLNTAMKVRRAKNNRIFIENRFTQNKVDLGRAEEEMQAFQEQYGAIALPEQMQAAVQAAAEIEAKIVATEIELAVQEKYLSPDHAKIVNLRNLLSELRLKQKDLSFGNQDRATNGGKEFEIFIPFAEIPDIGVKYVRNLRNVEVQNKLYRLLLEQYELAKLEESRQTPTVQILDVAEPPYRKDSPKRALVGAISALSATLIYVFLLCVNLRLRVLAEHDPSRYQKIVSHLPFGRKMTKSLKY